MSHKDDDFTELVDADIPRVDIVGKAANGRRFALIKSEPLLSADQVEELVKEATDSLQEGTVSKKTDAPADVIKDDADLDVTEPLAEPDGALDELEAATPGSPEWEQVDASTALKWAAIAARLKNAIETLSAREGTEAATVDPDDAENEWTLADLACAADYIINGLGGYAAGEQAEADIADEMETVGKAVAEIDAQLPMVEGLSAIVKAGRTLSAANESALRTAADSIQKVLASLPAAPDDVEKKEAVVAEEKPVTKADGEEQAKQILVYGPKGASAGPIGSVDPTDLTTFANSSDTDDASTGDDSDAADGSDDASADDSADSTDAADAATPVDANETANQTAATTDSAAPIPGTDTIQSPTEGDDTDVKKGSLITPEVLALFGELLDPIAKKLDMSVELAGKVDGLQERVEKLAKSPDDRRSPVLNGANGIPGLANRGEEEVGIDDIQKAIEQETDPALRKELQTKLVYAQIRSRFA